ncbi:MAG: precorrin-8X methylmutase [Prochlorococcaceae cyanobacterium]
MASAAGLDHPIFTESIQRIQALLGPTGLPLLEQEVLERLIHSSGDPALAPLLTDTAMAAAAAAPMAARTFSNPVHSVLQWAPPQAPEGQTRAALGMAAALQAHPGAVVLIGSAPTALELLLDRVAQGDRAPALVIGMPVGFVGVADSKRRLAASGLPQIRLEGTRGGAGLVAAAVNALLRRAWLDQQANG